MLWREKSCVTSLPARKWTSGARQKQNSSIKPLKRDLEFLLRRTWKEMFRFYVLGGEREFLIDFFSEFWYVYGKSQHIKFEGFLRFFFLIFNFSHMSSLIEFDYSCLMLPIKCILADFLFYLLKNLSMYVLLFFFIVRTQSILRELRNGWKNVLG